MSEQIYNIIANPNQSRSQSGLFGGAQSDDSAAPDFGGTATVEQLQEQYQSDSFLQETFGSFENYLAYMDEANEMLGAQDWWNNEGVDTRTEAQRMREGDDTSSGSAQDTTRNDSRQSNYNARQSGYNAWLNSEENQALMQKYGIQSTYIDDKGDTYTWTGNGYMRTNINEDSRLGFNDVVKAGIIGTIGAGLGGAAGTALGGSLGLGGTATGMLQGAAGGLISGGLQGDIDPRTVLASAIMGGFDPGGSLANTLGMSADTFPSGLLSGSANSVLSQAIASGDVDLQNALIAGLIRGSANSITDFLANADDNSIEGQMNRIAEVHKADYYATHGTYEGYVPLSQDTLYNMAMEIPHIGTSDLGALVGEGGMLPFIDRVPVGWFNDLKESIFGLPVGTEMFYTPDGEMITSTDLLQQGYSPKEVWNATIFGGSGIDGYTYAGVAESNSWFDQLGDFLIEDTGLGAILDGAAAAQFEEEHGFDPRDNPQLARLIMAYGGRLDEDYIWAQNPRGDSNYYGIMSALENGLFGQGATWGYSGAGTDEDGNTVWPVSDVIQTSPPAPGSTSTPSGGATFAPDLPTLPGQTQPNSFLQGLLTYYLTSNVNNNGNDSEESDSTTSSSSSDSTTNTTSSEELVNSTGPIRDEMDVSGMLSGTRSGVYLPDVTDDDLSTEELPDDEDYIPGTIRTPFDINEALATTREMLPGTDSYFDTEPYLPAEEEELPTTTTDTPTNPGGRSPVSRGRDRPEWGELFAYKKLDKWKRARERLYKGMLS